MRRTASVAFAAMLVLSAVGVSAAALASPGNANADVAAQNDTNATIGPGERLSGVIGVQEAELEGEVETRAYEIALERANDSNASKAAIVAEQLNRTRERLQELRQRKTQLERARENGSIGLGEYRARTAKLAAETQTVTKIANRSEAAADGLPNETLAEHGINVSAIRQLAEGAEELTGPQVAAIARSIAGGPDGKPQAYEPPSANESIEYAADRVESARERLADVRERVNRTNASENATDALERAAEQLDRAERALAMARNASEAGNETRARRLADEASDHARQAVQSATTARERADRDRARDGDRTDGRDGDRTEQSPTPTGDQATGDGDDSTATPTPTPAERDGGQGGR